MLERYKAFTVLIANICRSIHKIKSEQMARHHLKSSHATCLLYLYKSGYMTAGELAAYSGEDKANISRSLDYLEKNGYLSRDVSKGKCYRSPFSLTERGTEVAVALSSEIGRILAAAGEGLTEEERLVMYHSLETINENLEKMHVIKT